VNYPYISSVGLSDSPFAFPRDVRWYARACLRNPWREEEEEEEAEVAVQSQWRAASKLRYNHSWPRYGPATQQDRMSVLAEKKK
jgi:hypothetical protein